MSEYTPEVSRNTSAEDRKSARVKPRIEWEIDSEGNEYVLVVHENAMERLAQRVMRESVTE